MREEHLEKILRERQAVKDALWNYHNALDTRQHGGVAASRLIDSIESALESPWKRGATLEGKQEQV